MKIAQIAPLYESVPPKFYGGTERIVSYLTEELVKQGHEVSLFASGDSVTKARLIAPCETALRLKKNCIDQLAHHFYMLELLQQKIEEFDIVHYHIDYQHFSLSRKNKKPNLTTMHGRLNIPDIFPLHKEFSEMPLISISNSQRAPLPTSNWVATIYHGLPKNLLEFNGGKGQYLAFLGRISPEKRVDRAIEIAIRCGVPLKIAAKVDKVDEEYFRREIKHLLNHPLIEFIGEVNDERKSTFLGNALALIFPIDWPEPFGLVMIEAMACGTPVVAFKNGSVPEIIDEGATGYIVNSVEEAVNIVNHKIPFFNRNLCRQTFEERFSAERMAKDYIKQYNLEIMRHGQNSFNLVKTV